MRIACIQHVEFEGLGQIQNWIDEHSYSLKTYHPYLDNQFPTIDTFDFLIVMGGPMSANDEDIFPWLTTEKSLIWQSYTHKKKIIGICLGAQLIASSFGEKIYLNPEKEIGWFKVNTIFNSFLPFPESFTPFHWHGETFDLPQNGELIIQSEACKNQVFLIGKNILGLQFHLEMGELEILKIIHHCESEIIESKYIQNIDTIKNQFHFIETNKAILFSILNVFIKA